MNNVTGIVGWTWPTFKSEKKRIRHNSNKYNNVSIAEAFNIHYGYRINEEVGSNIPVDLKIGDEFTVRVKDIRNGKVVFDNITTKENLVCRNNFKKYKNISPEFFTMNLTARVVETNPNQTVVDIIQPLFEKWINVTMSQPEVQYDINNPRTIKVRDLKLQNNGFVGKANINYISELLGDAYEIDAFIPGSHIVLNIERNFEQWNGKEVDVFVTNYIARPTINQKPLICSRKNYLSFLGDLFKIDLYKHYCDDDESWKASKNEEYKGIVTGIINSSKKCGVFVEIPKIGVTGMIKMNAQDIVKYKTGQELSVKIVDFDDMTYFDNVSQQRRHLEPYIIKDQKLQKCILKPVLELV